MSIDFQASESLRCSFLLCTKNQQKRLETKMQNSKNGYFVTVICPALSGTILV